MIRPGLPKQPIKLMLLFAGVSATVSLALILTALSLGIERPGAAGRMWLAAAFWFNLPGALVFAAGLVAVIAANGGLSEEIPDLTGVVISACISALIYGSLGLWLGVTLQRRRKRRELRSQAHQSLDTKNTMRGH